MKKNKVWLSLIIAGVAGSITAAAWSMSPAEPAAPEADVMADEGPGPMMQNLNLSADQIKLLKKDHQSKQRQMIKWRAEMETLRVDLRDAADEDKPDMGKIESLAKKMGEVHAQMTVDQIKGIIYLRSILTPEQRQRFETQAMRFEGKHMRGHFGAKSGMGIRHDRPADCPKDK